MYWQWLTGPSVAFLAAALVVRAQTGISAELERVIGILVPLVAALLSPLVAAIVLLFRQLLTEMRANREMSERLGRVVQANTTSADANTRANERLAEKVEQMGRRFDDIEHWREHGGHRGGQPE